MSEADANSSTLSTRPFNLLRPTCVGPGELGIKVFLLCVITLSMLALLFLLARLLQARYRAHGTIFPWPLCGGKQGRRGDEAASFFTVSDLFNHLVLLLCLYEMS
ncbi:hypothetical protein Naga_101673g1, partial [Nannochloropsis gaditana]